MIRMLKKHGNSQALVIDRTMMEMMGITADTPLQVTIRNGALMVTPSNGGIDAERFEASTTKIMRRYDGMLKRLAE
ncbi:MAG: hypothetical protein WD009_04810 [Phycisphaeraceae bacterium]